MRMSNIETIRQSFTVQAEEFENSSMNFTKEEYLDYTVSAIDISPNASVLEVAAGTCACGRALAAYAKNVTCLDVTPAMLEVGKQQAEKKKLNNMVFVQGTAEELPFLDKSFDIVISRLAFHHFKNIQKPFEEMRRVLRTGGKLVLIDMEAAKESLRDREDEIETWRDPSHIRNLSRNEIRNLFTKSGLEISKCESTKIPVSLTAWMELTKTPASVRDKIVDCMVKDIEEGLETGFSPCWKESEIFFLQRWLLTIGIKRD